MSREDPLRRTLARPEPLRTVLVTMSTSEGFDVVGTLPTTPGVALAAEAGGTHAPEVVIARGAWRHKRRENMGLDRQSSLRRLRAAAWVMMTLGAVLVPAHSAAADFTINQKNKVFSVRQITIKVGDRITFVNDDSVNHHVFSATQGSEIDIVQRPGRSDTVRFSRPGTVEVECAIHPEMTLEVQVRR